MSEFNGIIGFVMAASVFGLVLSIWVGVMLIWLARRSARKSQLEQRLGIADPTGETGRVIHLWHDGEEAVTTVPGPARQRRTDLGSRAGWPVRRSLVFLLVAGLMGLAAVFTFLVTSNIVLAIGLSVALFVVFRIVEKHRKSGTRFEQDMSMRGRLKSKLVVDRRD